MTKIEKFDEGFILLSRSLIHSMIFQNDKWLRVWIWCLLKANHKDTHVPIRTGRGDSVVKLKRGQFIFGRNSASKELKMPASTIRNVIHKLITCHNLDIKTDSHYSIITICNYEDYQNIDNYKRTGKRTTKGQAKDTDNNDKNDKEKNIHLDFVKLTPEQHNILLSKYGTTNTQTYIEKLNSYIGSKGKQYKSHYHTIISWLQKDNITGKKWDEV